MAVRLRVKEVAMEKGIGMGKLQRMSDVAYNTVRRIYKDPYYITTTETLGKIARALGVPVLAIWDICFEKLRTGKPLLNEPVGSYLGNQARRRIQPLDMVDNSISPCA